jgi:hypothetical protein
MKGFRYMGTPVESLDRDTLIKALLESIEETKRERENLSKVIEMWRLCGTRGGE